MQQLRIKLLWRTLGSAYTSMAGVPTVDDTLLDTVEDACRSALHAMPPFAAREFGFPRAFRAFYKVAQDQLRPMRPGESFRFYGPTWLPTDGLAFADEAQGDSTPWIEFGAFPDQGWAFVCCDTEDPLFGAVVLRNGETPWSRMVYEDEVWPDFEAFLASLTT